MAANSDKGIISDVEKLKQTEEGLKSLFSSLDGDNDINKLVFIDVLFEELYKKNNFLLYWNMAHLTKPVSVITKTQQGEITINLNLTITLDQDGKIGINVENKEVPWDLEIPDIEIGKVVELKKEWIEWIIVLD